MASVSKRLTYTAYNDPFVARGDLTPRYMSAVVEATEEVVEELPSNDNDEQLLRIRHSAAHVMAMAVQQIFPEAQVTIGPWIENGFYYDFYFPETTDPQTGETVASRKLTDSDLKQVKKAMDKICSKNYPITREEVSREEAERRIK
jgi:threonyl-tRNA synthetase